MPILLTVCNNSSMRNIIRRVKSVKLLNQLNGTRKIVPWKIALHPNPKPWKNLLGGGGGGNFPGAILRGAIFRSPS